MKAYKTQSGSWYEVDEERKLIRRLSGPGNPTVRVGEDGVWKAYEQLTVSMSGLVIVWSITPEGVYQTTITSALVEESKAN